MGGAVSAGQNNEELVDNLCHDGYIHSPRVEKVPHPPSPSYQHYVHVYSILAVKLLTSAKFTTLFALIVG